MWEPTAVLPSAIMNGDADGKPEELNTNVKKRKLPEENTASVPDTTSSPDHSVSKKSKTDLIDTETSLSTRESNEASVPTPVRFIAILVLFLTFPMNNFTLYY